jgi:hypothetical protein
MRILAAIGPPDLETANLVSVALQEQRSIELRDERSHRLQSIAPIF